MPTREGTTVADEQEQYEPVSPSLIACRRCASVLLDKPAERDLHDAHHKALRQLWQQRADQPAEQRPRGGEPGWQQRRGRRHP
jgi:hypothetical protein